jgi:T5orf172 domain
VNIKPHRGTDDGGRPPKLRLHKSDEAYLAKRFRQKRAKRLAEEARTADGLVKRSSIYVIGEEGQLNGPVKIGYSDNPLKRLATLQVGYPRKLVFHCLNMAVRSDCIKSAERAIHDQLYEHRLYGEWFDVSVETAVAAIALICDKRYL